MTPADNKQHMPNSSRGAHQVTDSGSVQDVHLEGGNWQLIGSAAQGVVWVVQDVCVTALCAVGKVCTTGVLSVTHQFDVVITLGCKVLLPLARVGLVCIVHLRNGNEHTGGTRQAATGVLIKCTGRCADLAGSLMQMRCRCRSGPPYTYTAKVMDGNGLGWQYELVRAAPKVCRCTREGEVHQEKLLHQRRPVIVCTDLLACDASSIGTVHHQR